MCFNRPCLAKIAGLPMSNDSKKKEKLKIDLLGFLSDLQGSDKLAEFIGVVIIILISVFIVYIGTWRAAYAKEFYNVVFEINFLEGVQPGMQIRYQGGVKIGEVVSIESNYSKHYLHAKIKNDFKIIKSGTKVSLRSGSFGSAYLDISTIPEFFSAESYRSNDIIPVSEVVPFQHTLQNVSDALANEDSTGSLLTKRVKDIRYMMYQLMVNKYAIPSEIRYIVRGVTSNVYDFFYKVKKFNDELLGSVSKMNDSLNNLANNLRNNIPKFRRTLDSLYSYTSYDPDRVSEKQYLHDEQLYYTILIRLNIIKKKTKEYKDAPYRLIFNTGY